MCQGSFTFKGVHFFPGLSTVLEFQRFMLYLTVDIDVLRVVFEHGRLVALWKLLLQQDVAEARLARGAVAHNHNLRQGRLTAAIIK